MNNPVLGTDLFGAPVRPAIKYRASGYYKPPGTGPAGETCGTCRHRVSIRMASRYWKCALNRAKWTHGYSTDIRMRSPACSAWQDEKG